jgi:ubiquinone/menaquinone biosynthesis C-methylase UbiE
MKRRRRKTGLIIGKEAAKAITSIENVETARKVEHSKYEHAYERDRYRMKRRRRFDARDDITALPCRGSYLDVSCGRGQMLIEAENLGFTPVQGTEIVSKLIDGKKIVYAEVHNLPFPDKSFDVVTMFDVIEHLIPGDDERACMEMARVARSHILLTANNKPSHNKYGEDLHINRRPYAEWDDLFRKWFPGQVIWIKGMRKYVSECWRVDL